MMDNKFFLQASHYLHQSSLVRETLAPESVLWSMRQAHHDSVAMGLGHGVVATVAPQHTITGKKERKGSSPGFIPIANSDV